MAVSPVDLRALLERAFPEAAVALKDFIGDGNHFRVRVISALFEGKTRVQRHKMVYQALGDQLHALSLEAITPQEEEIRKEAS